MNLRPLLFAVLLACIGSASAQQAPQASRPAQRPQAQATPPKLTPAQQAQLAKQDADMSQAAMQVMQMVDANRTGEVWDGASVAMKGLVTRDDFIKQITSDRNKLGKVTSRGKAVVSRSQFPAGGKVPQGLYINVAVPTRFANLDKPVRELVSFRLDDDKTWRVSGYSLR